jgi:predicted AAA+ superfamily ATPase
MQTIIQQKIADSLAAKLQPFTRRDVHLPIIPGKAMAIIGPRRAGKTTFLWQILADKVQQGMARDGLLYFNFEDERLAGLQATDLHLIVEEFFRMQPEMRDRQQVAYFLDEIQVIAGWEKFVRRLLDTEKIEIFISGSSARLLSREIATSMRGRSMEARVYPFSFREFLRQADSEPERPFHELPKAERSVVEKHLRTYLTEGGYPEAQGLDQRTRFELLRSYTDTAILRDIIERHAVSQPIALRWMVRHLLGNAGALFSIHKFYNDLRAQGLPVAKDTLHAFLSYLEDAFLIRTVSIASDSERRRTSNPRKAYPIDPGLIPVFDRSAKPNTGHALETAILLELDRRGAEVHYVRENGELEVDFLARSFDGTESLIQVCADTTGPQTMERELKSLHAAASSFPRAEKHLVTLTPESVAGDRPPGIQVHHAAAWLLGG